MAVNGGEACGMYQGPLIAGSRTSFKDLLLPARIHYLKMLQPTKIVVLAGEQTFKMSLWGPLQIQTITISLGLYVLTRRMGVQMQLEPSAG